jgi:hypothetical protein
MGGTIAFNVEPIDVVIPKGESKIASSARIRVESQCIVTTAVVRGEILACVEDF